MATMSELKATTTARERVEAAVAKAQASQPRLNAVVTFVDVEDQLAALNTIPGRTVSRHAGGLKG